LTSRRAKKYEEKKRKKMWSQSAGFA